MLKPNYFNNELIAILDLLRNRRWFQNSEILTNYGRKTTLFYASSAANITKVYRNWVLRVLRKRSILSAEGQSFFAS